MRIRAAAPGRPRAWEVAAPPGTTVGALAAATGLPRADHYAFGGRVVEASATLASAGAADGALLGPVEAVPCPARVAMVVVDGPDAGRVFLLPTGPHAIGRHPSVTILLSDPSVGALHAEVHVGLEGSVRVRDRASDSGTWVGSHRVTGPVDLGHGDELRVGTTRVRIERLDRVATGARPGGTVNRPPRVLVPAAPAPPSRPATVDVAPRSANLRNLLAMLVPSLAGVGLAAAVRPDMVVLALLAPIGALASWLVLRAHDARTAARARKEAARRGQLHDASLAEHRRALAARLRVLHPDLGEVLCRVRRGDPRLWERRPMHDDFLRVSVGVGDLPACEGVGPLHDVPVEVDAATPIGIAGDRAAARSLARALVLQVAVHHGPADVAISVWTTDPLAWGWVRWLPHGDPSVTVLTDERVIADQVARWPAASHGPRPFVVLDAHGMPAAWRASWRALLDARAQPRSGADARTAAPLAAVVLAEDRHALPEQCATVICMRDRGDRIGDGRRFDAIATSQGATEPIVVQRPHRLDVGLAEDAAAGLTPRRDPDLVHGERSLPTSIGLVELVGFDPAHRSPDRDAVIARWVASAHNGTFAAPIGVDTSGPLVLDLVADGPHGLIAGTTGSGKSELLRSLVASFAATLDAEHLAFVLVDYKGGSAFDGLAALPHVVDVVTDLDAATARRAVHGLEAEVHRRERALRAAGTADIVGYHHARRTDPTHPPMPRLLLVVDEFATLAQELPAFVDALVDIAQRGRSLGVHLLLATQRPAGAVKDAIRTNTNLRIALRVLDAADSRDVLGSDDAASIARGRFGRAIVRLGAGDLRPFQAAYVSGATGRTTIERPLAIAPIGVALAAPADDDPTPDLDRIVQAVIEAHDAERRTAPVRPWADPLPTDLTIALLDAHLADSAASDVARTTEHLAFGLGDDAHAQRHAVARWRPAGGNLLVAGMAGSGTTTALVTLAAATIDAPIPRARRPEGIVPAPESAHVYVITTDPSAFAWFAPLHHVGAVIATDDDERVRRLLRMLCTKIDQRRRGEETPRRNVLVLLDGIGALRAAYDSLAGMETLDQIDRLATDGPSVGIHVAFAAEHPSAVGHRIDRTISHRVLLRLGDRHDYVAAGVRDIDPTSLAPGAGVDASTGMRLQIARLSHADIDRLVRHAALASATGEPAPRVGVLPTTVDTGQLAPASVDAGQLHLPLGIGDRTLEPLALRLHAGEHALVTGPTRCGKSNVLAVAHASLRTAKVPVVSIGTHRSPLPGTLTERDEIVRHIDGLLAAARSAISTVVLVDDADVVDDGGALERLVAARRPDIHVIAAARSDRLRSLFRHWTNEVRRSGNAVLLRPDDGDADVVGVRLPRAAGLLPPGRGWVVCDGIAELCQLALAASTVPTAGRAA